jgi:hypothetical protein
VMRMVSGGIKRQLLHQAVVFATLIVADLPYAEIASGQDVREEAMRKSCGLAETTSPRAQVLSAYSGALALSAATWGAPLVTMYALRYDDAVGTNAKAAPNTIWRMEDISTPELSQTAGYVSPNVNTLYGFGFLDLAAQPVILTVPDSNGRYSMVEIVDFWTNAFAYAGGVETGYKGGKFALVGPGWKGRLPPDVKRIDAPTRWVLIQPRVHVTGRHDCRRPRPFSTPSPSRVLQKRAAGKRPRRRPIITPRRSSAMQSSPSARSPSRTRFSFGKFSPRL